MAKTIKQAIAKAAMQALVDSIKTLTSGIEQANDNLVAVGKLINQQNKLMKEMIDLNEEQADILVEVRERLAKRQGPKQSTDGGQRAKTLDES